MKFTELQKKMMDDMLTDYWYSQIKYNPNWEKEYEELQNFFAKLMNEEK
jgi:hypothetical protein